MKSDVKSLWPSYYHDIREFIALAQAQDAELDALFAFQQALLQNRYIETADVQGIARHEAAAGILPDPLLWGTDFRRQLLLSFRSVKPPYTLRSVLLALARIFPGQKFSISINAAKLKMSVEADFPNREIVDAVIGVLRRVVPCNIVFSLVRKEKTHALTAQYTHQALSAYDHFELMGEILPQ